MGFAVIIEASGPAKGCVVDFSAYRGCRASFFLVLRGYFRGGGSSVLPIRAAVSGFLFGSAAGA